MSASDAATMREQLDKPKRLTDFERIRAALVKGEDNDRLLDGRDFDHRHRYRLPLWAKRIIWHVDGSAGRSIEFWIKAKSLRYNVGVGLAERICSGPHTDGWYSNDDHRCLCDRVRRRLDFIPF